MKLKNIIFALLAICCLPACSKDEPVVGGDSGETAEASVSFVVSSEPATKAAVTNKETFVQTLTAYIFKDESGYPLVASKKMTAQGNSSISRIEAIKVKVHLDENGNSTDKFVAVFVANATPSAEISSLDVLMASALKETADFSDGILPMCSEKIRFANLKSGDNWVSADGNPEDGFLSGNVSSSAGKAHVELTRLVSRVEVSKLDVNFSKETAEGSIPVKYPNASFTLHEISLVNVNANTRIAGDGVAETYLRGLKDEVYDPIKEDLTWLAASGYSAYLTQDYSNNPVEMKDSYDFDFVGGNGKTKDGEAFVKYIYPNTETKGTALLISGMFKRSEIATPEMKYYRVYLNAERITAPAAIGRNNVYQLTIHISGEGSPKPDPVLETVGVSLELSIKPWEVYVQNETITN